MTKPDTSPNDFKLNRLPTSLVKAFRDLPAPASAAAAIGEYRSAYIGPAFIRVPAPLIMKAARFGGWHGKVFRANAGDDQVLDGMNMFGDVAARNERFPMTASIGPSSIDGKPALIVKYPTSTPSPWNRATDELRMIDENTVLGITWFAIPMGKLMRLPFLLRREAS